MRAVKTTQWDVAHLVAASPSVSACTLLEWAHLPAAIAAADPNCPETIVLRNGFGEPGVRQAAAARPVLSPMLRGFLLATGGADRMETAQTITIMLRRPDLNITSPELALILSGIGFQARAHQLLMAAIAAHPSLRPEMVQWLPSELFAGIAGRTGWLLPLLLNRQPSPQARRTSWPIVQRADHLTWSMLGHLTTDEAGLVAQLAYEIDDGHGPAEDVVTLALRTCGLQLA